MFLGIFTRFFLIFMVLLGLFFLIKNVVKKNTDLKHKIIFSSLSIPLFIVLFFSFTSKSISQPHINDNIKEPIVWFTENKTIKEDVIYTYTYDCVAYYGEICYYNITDDEKNTLQANFSSLNKKNDKGVDIYYSEVACVRDGWGHPNLVVGDIRLIYDDLYIGIKYKYKDSEKIPIIKHITFSEYFRMEEIVLLDIFKSIDDESIVIMDKSEVWENKTGDGYMS